MRKPFVAANWKMFKSVQEAVVFAKQFKGLVIDIEDVEIVVAPPFTALHGVCEAVRNTNVGVAGQNLHWENEGAFTGEISGPMLAEAGADYVVIGHSERRTLFGELDEEVNRKIRAALAAELTPIVCVGETLEEREANRTLEVLDRQMRQGLDGLEARSASDLVIAYEPVWAIGTGRVATAAQAGDAHAHIRTRLSESFGTEAAEAIRIIYGGSVKPANIEELIAKPEIDGALVGGASLDVQSFHDIVVKSQPPAV